PRLRLQVRQVLHDRGVLGKHLAVVELERGDVAFWIDREIVGAGLCRLGLEVDPDRLDGDRSFIRHDLRRECTAFEYVIELHGSLLFWVWVVIGYSVVGNNRLAIRACDRRYAGKDEPGLRKDSGRTAKFFCGAANPSCSRRRLERVGP